MVRTEEVGGKIQSREGTEEAEGVIQRMDLTGGPVKV